MIELFDHNRKAYEAVVAMLAETGKAAVVHPTGTGKSFIGFKLCEDNPEKKICWLSPSEYIFKTQIENLKAASDGYEPENVIFYTYAKLMLMSAAEIEEVKPDYIVLDEFHRCGAEFWGQGVQNLLNQYPDVPILGLSATAVRYLDNQRDMADELFEGNIASEMTLGEAIVRGILNPPKYVQSVYSYQKDFDDYARRVRNARTKAVKDAGERYLDAIRRAIERADGLDTVFAKHMTEKTGKYIVFCANKEHMDEMQAHAHEWFRKVDIHPHIYSLYTEDPAASKSFEAFKQDTDETHLRLLYAIDALNEGVHVEDVSGVILLRPTVSPIIYKQQIGRALSASKKKAPVIFDIVNNVENLYSIGSIQEEMRAAITYYNYFDNDFDIVNDRFEVFDEVKDCKLLFEQLEETLTASWDYMYAEAKRYFDANGDLEVPARYKTAEGYSLGSWLQTQRQIKAGERFGNLDESRVAKLDAIGMRWDSFKDLAWERYYTAAKQYYTDHGDLNVKTNFITDGGVKLGTWIANLRNLRRAGSRSAYLTKDRLALLEQIGMIWDQPDYVFERNYAAALAYYREHGDLDAPTKCVVNGVKLDVWLRSLRTQQKDGQLTDEQIQRLRRIGMRWIDKHAASWEEGFAEAQRYIDANGDLKVTVAYQTKAGYPLGKWISRQREAYRAGKLSKERIDRLDKIGMSWSEARQNDWDECFKFVKLFYEQNGHINLPTDYKVNGIWLNKWLNEQKQIYHGKKTGKSLTAEQISMLESLGMQWESKSQRAWNEQYKVLLGFYREQGHIQVPPMSPLASWLATQRKKYQNGTLSASHICKLDALGMVWQTDDNWEVGFRHARAYLTQHPGESLPTKYICSDGYKLGIWWSNQRQKFAAGKLDQEQIDRLAAIGLTLAGTRFDAQWQSCYEIYKQYKLTHHAEPAVREKVNGVNLQDWLRTQRLKYREGSLNAEKTRLLEAAGVDWLFPAERKWEEYYGSASHFYESHGHLDVPAGYKDENGRSLGAWVKKQSAEKDEMAVTWANGDQKARLERIGIRWSGV